MEVKCYNGQTTTKGVSDMSDYKYKYNAKTIEYNSKYVKEHYDVYNLKMPVGMKDKLKQLAADNNKSVNQYLIELIQTQL